MGNKDDYGGQGLNRGSSYHIKKRLPQGVVWSEMAKKWLCRIKKNGIICTMGGYEKKEEAERQYEILNSKYNGNNDN